MKVRYVAASDPTMTLTLRNKFVIDFSSRFMSLNQATSVSVKDNDCFGVGKKPSARSSFFSAFTPEKVMAQEPSYASYGVAPIPQHAFSEMTDASKMSSFYDWFKDTEDKILFEVQNSDLTGRNINDFETESAAANSIWTQIYLYNAYLAGIRWARVRMKQEPAGLKTIGKTQDDINTSPDATIRSYNSPAHKAKAESLYLRTFIDLKGITSAQEAQVLRVINEGLSAGYSPKKIAANIRDRVNSIGKHRSILLARTETIRAHHVASIQEYRAWGVPSVTIQAEFKTAGDNRVCELCAPLDGKIYSLETIENMIPVHPQCRCAALPYFEEIT